MGLGYIIILAFGAFAAIKFYQNSAAIAAAKQNTSSSGVGSALAPGVSYYDPLAITQRPAQVQAFDPSTNNDSTWAYDAAAPVTGTGPYVPAFGPTENMPDQTGGKEWTGMGGF